MQLKTAKILSILFFVGVLIVNYLATALPIGGRTTGELSDSYPNLFTPAGFTFSIWGVIYLALLVFVVYQAKSLFSKSDNSNDTLVQKVAPWFLLSCVFNMLWIVLWHYQQVLLSVVVMLGILYSLFNIILLISKEEKTKKNGIFYFKIPFGLYFGWITVATVANITALLVNIGWGGFGLSEAAWAAAMLLVATGITLFNVRQFKNIFIAFSVIWALYGIVSKRLHNLDAEPYTFLPYLGIACIVIITVYIVISSRLKAN